ncbi:MAG: hypothetical protein J5I94_10320 [Phaeodactylibacter sp.]|nr:hypothetical protein [Phaeodactylibacter sp.]
MNKLSLLALLLSFAFFTCNNNGGEEDPSPALDCAVDVAECITNGSNQSYRVDKINGVVVRDNDCVESLQVNFNMDGGFSWFHGCPADVGLDAPFTGGEWSLENDKAEIRIKHPDPAINTDMSWRILELNEEELVVPMPGYSLTGRDTFTWRRI